MIKSRPEKFRLTNPDATALKPYAAVTAFRWMTRSRTNFRRCTAIIKKISRWTRSLSTFFQETDADLAILTNGDHGHQYAKLSTLGVFDYFHPSHVFTSGKIGFAKPDPRAFTEVMDTLNENAMDWYYIGDSYGNDMEGAKNVGMKTIHFNRHHGPEGEAADYVVYSEKQLIELLKELSA